MAQVLRPAVAAQPAYLCWRGAEEARGPVPFGRSVLRKSVVRCGLFKSSSSTQSGYTRRAVRECRGRVSAVAASSADDVGDGSSIGREGDFQRVQPLLEAFGNGSSDGGLPNQGTSVVEGPGTLTAETFTMPTDVSYLQELIAIQQSGPKCIGFFGTRNMGFLHQQLIEILSYAMVLTSNHVFTSGATGTNAAVIRGCLRAERPDLLTVILPQSRSKQPSESQELLEQVANVVEMPENDDLQLIDASRHCNEEILNRVQQVICFAFHDSNLLLETCREAKMMRKIVTLFYLD